MTNMEKAVLKSIDIALCKKYGVKEPEGEHKKLYEDQLNSIPALVLESDLDYILTNAKSEAEYMEIIDYVKTVYAGKVVQDILASAEHSSGVRRDLGKALKNARKGSDLSGVLGYGFTKRDIVKLVELHKAGKYRKKIEDLLDDCNFHEESSLMSDGLYEKILNKE